MTRWGVTGMGQEEGAGDLEQELGC
jgi:hypothetical protein